MPPPPTVAKLSTISNTEGKVKVSTNGTKPAPGSKIVSWTIGWGDGTNQQGNGKPPIELNHVYSTSGKYDLKLIVKDSKNKFADDSMGMIVQINSSTPVPPPSTCTVTVAPTVAAVQAAHDAASPGDVICLQAGDETWTNAVNITKAVTIRGAGVGQTIIRNNNVVGAGRLFNITLVAGQNTYLNGIEFPDTTAGTNGQGIINVQGSSDQDGSRIVIGDLQIDDFGADNFSAYGIWCDGAIGVLYNIEFNIDDTNHVAIEVQHENWGGHSFGDGAWAVDSLYGTDQFLFIEDCTYNGTGVTTTFGGVLVDGLNGCRWVQRYCTLVNCQSGPHGTESGGRQRSGRAFEVYNCAYSGMFPAGIPVHNRGGSCLIHDNTFANVVVPTVSFALEYKRLSASFDPWGSADGTNAWDVNFGGGPFESGTVTSGGIGTLTDSSKSWTVNQWVGYSAKLTSGCSAGVTANSCAAVIISNTSNTLTFRYEVYAPGPFSPAVGNTYQIWKVNEGLDQPGKGLGTLLSGNPPSVPVGWNDQVDDPCYEWNNTGDGTVAAIVWDPQLEGSQIRAGEHYFTATAKPGYSPYPYPHSLRPA